MSEAEEPFYTLDHPAVVASLEALSYGRKSWEAARDECYAWLKMSESFVVETSNTGHKYIYWYASRDRQGRIKARRANYAVRLSGPWGLKHVRMHAPRTLEEARVSPLLIKAVEKRDSLLAELVGEHGAPDEIAAHGQGAEIRKVLEASDPGRRYLRTCTSAVDRISMKIKTAKAYAYDDWNADSSYSVHLIFRAQPDRLQLISRTWTVGAANAEVKQRTSSEPRDPFRLDEPAQPTSKDTVETDIDKWLELTKKLDKAGVLVEAWIEYEDQQKFTGRTLKAVA